jgi:8-oxo-dGTP pyrophosphatase MutT (NUDIX family)
MEANENRQGKEGSRKRARGRRNRHRSNNNIPDILYHACSLERANQAKSSGTLSFEDDRFLFMSKSESQAWLVAHRSEAEPFVVYVDATRARQSGTKFHVNNRGLWQASSVPVKHLLNLRNGFGHQLSAGAFPVYYGPDGPEVALIKVRRRFGSTWEIAKGKLEPGEDPIRCAMREVQEEMGVIMPMELERDFGFVRFGFMTPEREPRLKTLFVYQMRALERVVDFDPPSRESIVDVGWFTPKQVNEVVTHRSLRPLVRQLLQNLAG